MTTMPDYLLTQRELIPTVIFNQSREASVAVAREMAQLIRDKAAKKQNAVLGLATGSTPTGVYAELIRMHREEGLSFKNVITFNLDEYFPMQPHELQSYVRFMNEHLFDHIDIDRRNVHIPDGTLALEQMPEHCAGYERAIAEAGGIDLQILGIGRTGHVGFNEPGSGRNSVTRLITLDNVTRNDAAADFFGKENVPRRAITMGVATILRAKRILLMAFGEGKAPVVAKAIEGEITDQIAASFLQEHPNAQIMLDAAASAQLTRTKAPWVLGPIEWDEATIRTAVIWLARKVKKPILKLTDEDYNENHLQDLLADHGSAYDINVRVFRLMQRTITGWPGGKPEHLKKPGDMTRPTDRIFPKRVICFSPHPDDDVISMGGTLIRLADHGHEVHIAYQTSGNIAVFDDDARRFTDFAAEFNQIFGIDKQQTVEIEKHIEQFLKNREPGQTDSPQIQKIKGMIRRGEAKAGARAAGVPEEHCHFLDMPFYETGTVRKKAIGDEDVKIIVELLREIKPHQIYAAGDLSDPHGTHRVCLSAIIRAIEILRDEKWFDDCEVWLYRGAWQEWEPEKIEMAVPISPDELMRKRVAIFKHQSQKDKAMFPGSDKREFWQRAEDRNRDTARIYDELGLPEYEAMEGFVRWDGHTRYL
ncbi:MAG: glucosamine-6-phosphate deaminase [Planctomycetes bacterium]|nr:glucosamine-6-phosphate deaminase [Planctomycetota bacterium]